jgi:hypothetical protein
MCQDGKPESCLKCTGELSNPVLTTTPSPTLPTDALSVTNDDEVDEETIDQALNAEEAQSDSMPEERGDSDCDVKESSDDVVAPTTTTEEDKV